MYLIKTFIFIWWRIVIILYCLGYQERVTAHCLLSSFDWQAKRAVKTVRENKRDQEILYTLTIPQASTKDSGIYSCSITDIISNENQTKHLAINVFGMKAELCLFPVKKHATVFH